jgi:poly(3-hydroxybutyrate) depolymerase
MFTASSHPVRGARRRTSVATFWAVAVLVTGSAVSAAANATVDPRRTGTSGTTRLPATPFAPSPVVTGHVARVPAGPTVETLRIAYRSHTGRVRHATVVFPARRRGLRRTDLMPLIISPHGRALDGVINARLWGNLPAVGNFVVVNPDGQGNHLASMSWGASGQIADLARMPAIVTRALPWLRIDRSRVYAFGGSMGGQESLLLAARYPRLLAGVAAFDSVTDFARQYRNFHRLGCAAACRLRFGRPLGAVLRQLAVREVGGTPRSGAPEYARRSALAYAARLARSGVPLQIWWSVLDRIVVDSDLQSGRLLHEIRRLDAGAPVEAFRGRWAHTAVFHAKRRLPLALARFGLLPQRFNRRPAEIAYLPSAVR